MHYLPKAILLCAVGVAIASVAPAHAQTKKVQENFKTVPMQPGLAAGAVDPKVLGAISFTIQPNIANDAHVLQWTMKAGSDGRPILSGNRYRMVNLAAERGLKRQKRPVAANLGWLEKNSGDFNVLIQRKSGQGQVKYGDVVALNLASYGWLRYKKQSAGINVSDDDKNPHYIWMVEGGKPGMKVVAGLPFALRNVTVDADLIYCKRSHGIDLGWQKKSKCGGFLAEASTFAFGDNGLFSGGGLTGTGIKKLRSYVCEAGVGALSAALLLQTGAVAAPAVAVAAPIAIKKCETVSI
jgi:hypothetical protein